MPAMEETGNTSCIATDSFIQFPVKLYFQKPHIRPRKMKSIHSENPPDIKSATAKFITKYIPRVRRLRFLTKMIIVTTLKVTMTMLSVISRLSQVKHSGLDGENILKYDRNV